MSTIRDIVVKHRVILVVLCAVTMLLVTVVNLLLVQPSFESVHYDVDNDRIVGSIHGGSASNYAVVVFVYTDDWHLLTINGDALIPVKANGAFSASLQAERAQKPTQYLCYLVPHRLGEIYGVEAMEQARASSLAAVHGMLNVNASTSRPIAQSAPSARMLENVASAPSVISLPETSFVQYSPTPQISVLAQARYTAPRQAARLTDVRYTSDYHVEGRVISDNPQAYRVILFIYTDQFYVKPFFSPGEGLEMSEVGADGTFRIAAFSAGVVELDLEATRYAVYLVEETYTGIEHMNDIRGAIDASLDHYISEIPVQ